MTQSLVEIHLIISLLTLYPHCQITLSTIILPVKMEKYNDAESISQMSDSENTSFLNTQYLKEDSQRRRNYVYLTLFNLFIFTLSMLSLICAVMSQKDDSGHSAAKLMDQFDVFCECAFRPNRMDGSNAT